MSANLELGSLGLTVFLKKQMEVKIQMKVLTILSSLLNLQSHIDSIKLKLYFFNFGKAFKMSYMWTI